MKNADSIIQAILEYNSVRYKPEEYPALGLQLREWKQSRPLEGMRILAATPLFNNTLLEYVPLLAAGAELTAATTDFFCFDPALPPSLKKWGLPYVHNDRSGTYDCILDCGGHHAGLKPVYGYAELTRSGAYHYEHTDKPVILVDDSRIKAIETCLGTGNGFLRAMNKLGYNDFTGKKVVLFGYGKVGRGIAFFLHKAGAEITVVDNPETVVPAYLRFISRFDKAALGETVREAWCVVTATGVRNAMAGNGAAEILRDSNQIVAAMGAEDEWCGALPESRILFGGRPLNFMLEEPTHLRYIDPSMALLNAAALELVSRKLPSGLQKINPEIERHLWNAVEKGGLIAEELKESGL